MSHTSDQLADIGREVNRARVSKGLSKEQAAIRAGVSSITWKRVEDGQVVRDANLSKILSVLGLHAEGIPEPAAPQAQDTDGVGLLRHVSDGELIAELVDRLAQRHRHGGPERGHPNHVGDLIRGSLPGRNRVAGNAFEDSRDLG